MADSALSVMVVEDHGFQRRMAVRLLNDLGVRKTSEAAEGKSALLALMAMETHPDVLLVDLDLPGMDGIEFIAHVAERQLVKSVIVFSALDPALLHTVQSMARAYGLEVLGCIEKPLTREKLAAVLVGARRMFPAPAPEDGFEVTAENLREALALGHIRPWFQPQIEMSNGRAVCGEALARWVLPDGRVVMPNRFIALIESEGLADEFTASVLQQACRAKRQWAREGLDLKIAVNVSPLILDDPILADRYQVLVLSEGVEPPDVVLEITETTVLGEGARTLGLLARLRLKGFGLSIDDFGTGYSSLAQLSQIPFTELKIDYRFVSGAHRDTRKRAVIEASLSLARQLRLNTVAEGVETQEEWQLLADLDCHMMQGYLVTRPVPAEDLSAVLARWRAPGA